MDSRHHHTAMHLTYKICEGMECVHNSLNKIQCMTLLKTVINIRVA